MNLFHELIDFGQHGYIIWNLPGGYVMWAGTWPSAIVLGATLTAAAAMLGCFAAIVRRK